MGSIGWRQMTRCGWRMAAAVALSAAAAGPAAAQEGSPGSALRFSSALDVLPGVPYVFRGIIQEADPKITIVPQANLGIALFAADGPVRQVTLDLGVWHSLQTGSSGLDGPTEGLHYEEDFYATLTFGLRGAAALAATYTAYASPNGLFGAVHELAFRLSTSHALAPYGLVALELAGTADGNDSGRGTYLELGIAPRWPLGGGGAYLTVPVAVGLSLKDYFQHPLDGTDHRFGFADAGAIVSVPLRAVAARFGDWSVHAGVDVYAFGESTKAFNAGGRSKVVGLFGFSVAY